MWGGGGSWGLRVQTATGVSQLEAIVKDPSALVMVCERLDNAAASGEVVELSGELTQLTLDMVGHAASG